MILGTPDEVVDQLATLWSDLPISTVVVRAQWPGMSIEDVCAHLDDLGRHVVGPLINV